jgi:hypothetical protein
MSTEIDEKPKLSMKQLDERIKYLEQTQNPPDDELTRHLRQLNVLLAMHIDIMAGMNSFEIKHYMKVVKEVLKENETLKTVFDVQELQKKQLLDKQKEEKQDV